MRTLLRVICGVLGIFLGYYGLMAFSFANGMANFNGGSTTGMGVIQNLIWIHAAGLVLALISFAAFGGRKKEKNINP